MHLKSLMFFKVLTNKFHPGAGESFFKQLPPEEAKEIAQLSVSAQDPVTALVWPQELIRRTHYSWLAPLIAKMPATTQDLVIASLEEHQAVKLQEMLKRKGGLLPLKPSVKGFFLNELYQVWKPEEAIPISYLPSSSLSQLLELSKPELVNLVDYLALYDLADAVRNIVSKNELKNIYLCLTTNQQRFLRQCLHKNEKIAAPKLDLASWDGSCKKLKELLHIRGLFRLGKAICGQHPLFLWYLTRRLDSGRGKIIQGHYVEKKIPIITPLLVEQVLIVINFLKLKGNP